MVKVIFLGPFGNLLPEEDEKGYWLVDAAGQTVEALIETTKVKDSSMNYSVLVNDLQQPKDYIMKDEEEVAILPLFYAG